MSSARQVAQSFRPSCRHSTKIVPSQHCTCFQASLHPVAVLSCLAQYISQRFSERTEDQLKAG